MFLQSYGEIVQLKRCVFLQCERLRGATKLLGVPYSPMRQLQRESWKFKKTGAGANFRGSFCSWGA